MTDNPPYVTRLRKLARDDPKVEHTRDIERELYTPGNDRATGVLFGSFTESALKRLLTWAMRGDLVKKDADRLFGFEGPIGSFSARIMVAYAFKLIGPVSRSDLDLIRTIRNEFAHSRMPLSFSTPEVSEVCAHLRICDLMGATLPIGYLDTVSHGELGDHTTMAHPKARFIATCHSLSYRMWLKINGPREGDWAFPDDEPLP